MESHAYLPTYELFFVLESFQGCFAEYVTALRPLRDRVQHGLLGCDVYYREDTDVALLSMRFDERSLDAERLSWILDFAGGAGLAALDPAMLPAEDRRRFYKRYLEEYPLRAEDRPMPEDALQGLAETLGLRVPRPRVLTNRVVRTAAPSDERITRVDPDAIERARKASEATATWRSQRPTAPQRPIAARTSPANDGTAIPDEIRDQPTQPSERKLASRRAVGSDSESAPRRTPRASPAPIARVRLGSDSDAKTAARSRSPGSRPPGVPGGSSSRSPNDGDEPPQISVRFRRGDDWVPARLRSLGLKGAYLACGAPPRMHDDVHIALGLGPLGTVMRGSVVHVTGAEDARESGAAGFGVLFPTIESPSRRQLKELLQEARKRGVVLEAPPPRGAVRFPVRWPVHVVLPNQQGIDLAALDVSAQGMFLSTLDRLPAGALDFYMPTERGGAPIHGRLRAVREVPWKMACSRGLHSGFGMQIVDFSRADDSRYADFVTRVGRRVQRRLVIGASAERTEELVSGLAAAGYTVSGSSDPATLIKLAECDPRPPDAALLDASISLPGDLAHRLERLLAMRQVPLIRTAGEPAYRARAVIDGLLAVTRAE